MLSQSLSKKYHKNFKTVHLNDINFLNSKNAKFSF